MRTRLGALALALTLTGCARGPWIGPERHSAVEPLKVDEAEARAAISSYRQAHGLSEVALDPALDRVAQRQAEAMAAANELSHTVAGDLADRLSAEDADRRAAVENVSAGYATFDAALGGWRRSLAHDANLLSGPMRRMGIAGASEPGTRYKTFWALVMTN